VLTVSVSVFAIANATDYEKQGWHRLEPKRRAGHAGPGGPWKPRLAPESALPTNVRQAPPTVREAYRFAIANRDILKQIPCYCGCGAEHQSNAECYIKDVRPDGTIEFDLMSFG